MTITDARSRRAICLTVVMACIAWLAPAEAERRIDVNSASSAELQRLTGIGPVLAEAIIEHRERNGPFRTVDELTNVTGIGPATLGQIRDDVRVGKGGPPRAKQPGAKAARPDQPSARREVGPQQELDLTRQERGSTIADRRAALEARQEQRGEPRTAPPPRPSRHEEADIPAPTTPPSAPGNLININTADEQMLTKLPGIGPARASAIIAHRRAEGPFRRIDDLTDVSGIGPATLNNVRDLVTIAIDLNRASLQELEAIGIDMDAAQRLVDWRRQHGPFRSVEQLTEVPGFGTGALDTLRPFLWVEST